MIVLSILAETTVPIDVVFLADLGAVRLKGGSDDGSELPFYEIFFNSVLDGDLSLAEL